MKCKALLSALFVCLFALPLAGAVRGNKAMYVGGTITNVPEKTKGTLDLTSEDVAVFSAKNGQKFEIPYKNISSLEFGQKVGRRVGAAIAVTPFLLFSKKRKHYFTIGFADKDGNKQGAVLELAKVIVQSTLTTFETRSGIKIEYESEEARKNAND
jgi:autotransporter adhesin